MSLLKIVVLSLILFVACYESMPASSQMKKAERQVRDVAEHIESTGIFDEMAVWLDQAAQATLGRNPQKRFNRLLQQIFD